MHKISIGTWAYSVGPYADNPVPFGAVVQRLKELKFDGLDPLVAQMKRDDAEARALLAGVEPLSDLDARVAF